MAKKYDKHQDFLNSLSRGWGLEAYYFDSSVIHFAFHSSEKNMLGITFTSGKEYNYMNVDVDVWKAFADADSQGKFFNKYIRGKYDFEFVEDAA